MWKEPVGVSYDNHVLPYTSKTESDSSISTSEGNISQSNSTVKLGNEKMSYDIMQIKRISQNRSTSANAFTTSLANPITNNISDSKQNSNSGTKYSMHYGEKI